MHVEVKVPALPESVADATVVTWHKNAGDSISRDEPLVDLETDKVVLEVPAPQDGILAEIVQQTGSTVVADDVLARLSTTATASSTKAPSTTTIAIASDTTTTGAQIEPSLSPSVRRLVAEMNVDVGQLVGTGKDNRITKTDVMNHVEQRDSVVTKPVSSKPIDNSTTVTADGDRPQKRVPMTRLRAKIAERLVQSQSEAAILTTFNEINLHAVMELRKRHKESFEKVHGVRLGFMSFFAKAAAEALKKFPAVNASIDGNDIIYHGYYDIGIAVSTERGLVVPVLRDVEQMTMADVERSVNDYAARAREGKLSLDEMTGGTFTITNGGVFGSLLATPIINPPQTGILGMHAIQERPIAENGAVVIRPMMYVALSYDHRIIDGKESVSFLVEIKKLLEDPTRLVLGL